MTSSLHHAVGILVFGSDQVSTVLNMGWLALALAAAFAIGRRYGVAAATTMGVALVMATPMIVATQPGGRSRMRELPDDRVAARRTSSRVLPRGCRLRTTRTQSGRCRRTRTAGWRPDEIGHELQRVLGPVGLVVEYEALAAVCAPSRHRVAATCGPCSRVRRCSTGGTTGTVTQGCERSAGIRSVRVGAPRKPVLVVTGRSPPAGETAAAFPASILDGHDVACVLRSARCDLRLATADRPGRHSCIGRIGVLAAAALLGPVAWSFAWRLLGSCTALRDAAPSSWSARVVLLAARPTGVHDGAGSAR